MARDLEKSIKNALSRFKKIQFACLYGSYGSGRQTERSDVDIAVASRKRLSPRERTKIMTSLSLALRKEVDIVDLQSVSGVIYQQAFGRGKILMNKDEAIYAGLLKKLWYEEADFMPMLRGILADRRKRFLR